MGGVLRKCVFVRGLCPDSQSDPQEGNNEDKLAVDGPIMLMCPAADISDSLVDISQC